MSTLFSHFFTKINQISPLDTNFTEVLDGIALKPKTLYFYGKMPENMVKNEKSGVLEPARRKSVAIVGSRRNTRYGAEIAYKLAYELAKHDVVVVSGLAFGIDSIGHQGCLDAGGTTVAVLGTAIDHIYPKAHVPLAAKILESGGAIISEYAPGNDPNTSYSFLERNRIISGLSDIVVVVEAAERSGTLNTAAHALSQGKTVFAVPGNITSYCSKGCNNLIKQGAIPYAEPDDVLRELFPEEYAKKRQKSVKIDGLKGDSLEETAILRAIASGISNGSEIAEKMSLAPEVFNQTITLLEIKSRVRSLGANHWALA